MKKILGEKRVGRRASGRDRSEVAPRLRDAGCARAARQAGMYGQQVPGNGLSFVKRCAQLGSRMLILVGGTAVVAVRANK
ncbi:MAG: hypothetical protein ACTS8S_16755 [Giesbergeria sp.]